MFSPDTGSKPNGKPAIGGCGCAMAMLVGASFPMALTASSSWTPPIASLERLET